MTTNLKPSKATIIRAIALALVVIRYVAKEMGHEIPVIDDSEIASFVEGVIDIGIVVCNFWYNNSFSQAALKADEYLKVLKGEDSTNE